MDSLKRLLGLHTEGYAIYLNDHFSWEGGVVMGELCQHLRQIGVNATLLDPDSPEALDLPSDLLGFVKIEGRNLDVVVVERYFDYLRSGISEIEVARVNDSTVWYYYDYFVRVNVDDLGDKLKADFDSDWRYRCCLKQNFIRQVDRSIIDKGISGARWRGGELARILNADSDLTQMLYSEGLDCLQISPNAEYNCVGIRHSHKFQNHCSMDSLPSDLKRIYYRYRTYGTYLSTFGRKQFPSHEAFEAYDRIAYAIRKVAKPNTG